MRLLKVVLSSTLWLAAPACHREAPAPPKEQAAAPAPDATFGVLATDSAAVSATHFAQAFYDWYAQRGWRLETAIRDGRAFFSSELHGALTADLEAQARSPNEIVGLDGDPFLNAQDGCPPYRVGQATRRADTILVAVHGECTDAEPRPGPDAIAEILRPNGRWVFVNFRYVHPNWDLLTNLAELRRARGADSPHER